MKERTADWKHDPDGSFYNYLPRGCEICRQGAGLVLFITGLCQRNCFYCPLSMERRGRDLIFADERPVKSEEDILEEARSISALGTGITGGEPLLKLDLVLELITLLKRELGPDHHVHLYTGTLPGRDVLKRLRDAGLDEIRIHPPLEAPIDVNGLVEVLTDARSLGLMAGVEIPAFAPAPEILEAVKRSEAFLNLNELEFSETNQETLRALGFRAGEVHCGALGSEELALTHFLDDEVKVHYCSSVFKDAVQLRERFKRRASRMARPFEVVTEDGTLIRGTVEGDFKEALKVLEDLGVPDDMYTVLGERIEIAPWILEEISGQLEEFGCTMALEESYPMEGGPVVERIPL